VKQLLYNLEYIREIFFIVRLLLKKKNFQIMNNKVDCYLSSSHDSYYAISSLKDQFNSDIYNFKYRNEPFEFLIKDSECIKNSKIFVAFVNSGYLESYIATSEFEMANSFKKPKLCIFLPDLSTIEKLRYGIAMPLEKIIDSLRQSEFLNLAKNDFNGKTWSIDILKRIHLSLDELKKKKDSFENGYLTIECTLNRPSIPDFQFLNLIKNVKIESRSSLLLFRSTLINSTKLAIIVFEILSKRYFIDIYDLNDSRVSRRFDCIKNPSLITTNSNSEILITDNSNGCLYIYDNNFLNMQAQLKLDLQNFNDICFDDQNNHVYFVKCVGHSEIKIYLINENIIRTMNKSWFYSNPFKPRSIKVIQDKVIILNACSLRIDQDNGTIIEKTYGESFIYILNKATFDIQKIIDFNNKYVQPWSLIIDNKSNIYTTVYKSDKNGTSVESERYLCKLDENGNILNDDVHKINTKYLQNDLFYSNNAFYFITENRISKYSIGCSTRL
jgi:hypothetical protein